MSRQKGRRQQPRRAPAKPAPKAKPARVKATVPYERRRVRNGLVAGTVLTLAATWLFVLGAVAVEDTEASSIPVFIALGLAPVGFFVMAKLARGADSLAATAQATVIGLGVGVAVILLAQDIVSGFVGMFGSGAIVALPRPHGTGIWERIAAVAFVTALVSVIVRVVPLVALVVGPGLAVPVLAAADALAVRKIAAQD